MVTINRKFTEGSLYIFKMDATKSVSICLIIINEIASKRTMSGFTALILETILDKWWRENSIRDVNR